MTIARLLAAAKGVTDMYFSHQSPPTDYKKMGALLDAIASLPADMGEQEYDMIPHWMTSELMAFYGEKEWSDRQEELRSCLDQQKGGG